MRSTSGSLSYLLADHLGSTTAVLDSSGGLASSQKYYPFGSQRSMNPVSTDKRFTGHQQEGSLYFMQARFYDPAIGRFLQPDTIVPDPSNPQSLNRYSYVLNNPLRYTDPTGHCADSPDFWSGCVEAVQDLFTGTVQSRAGILYDYIIRPAAQPIVSWGGWGRAWGAATSVARQTPPGAVTDWAPAQAISAAGGSAWSSTEGVRENAALFGVGALTLTAAVSQTGVATWTDAWAIAGCAAEKAVGGGCLEGAFVGYAIGFGTSSPVWAGAMLASWGATSLRASLDENAPGPAFNPGAFPEVNYRAVQYWMQAADDFRWIYRRRH